MRLFKFTLLTLTCLLSCFAYAQENDKPVPPPPIEEEVPSDEIFTIVQEMPRFPGCEDMEGTSDEKKKCAETKMLEYISDNIQYPTEARKKKIEGMAVVSFVVEKDGTITQPKLARDLDGGCGEEALRIVESMPKWIPGKQRNQPIRVQFNLPVRFKLDNTNQTTNNNDEVRRPYSYVKLTVQSTASYSFNIRTPSAIQLDPRGRRRVTLKVGQEVTYAKSFKQHPLFVVTHEMNGTVIDVTATAKLRNKGDTETIVYIEPPRGEVTPPAQSEGTYDPSTTRKDPTVNGSWRPHERGITTRGDYGTVMHHPALRDLIAEHKTVAILPISVTITDKKMAKSKQNTPEAIAEKEQQFQTNFQRSFYERLAQMQEKEKLTITVQDVDETNRLLAENGIETIEDIFDEEPSKITDILGVDALFSANVEILQMMSKGGALALSLLSDSAITSDRSKVALTLYDGYTGARIWEVRQKFDNFTPFWKTETLIQTMLKGEVDKYFPYHVRFR